MSIVPLDIAQNDLVNIVNGKITDSVINIHNAVAIGVNQMIKFEQCCMES